ncbi:MAG: hypothetical protein JSV68_09895 [Anaerolineaceae bacterium]|nr:MAG: hypothetical protein JSV68_09895 [Anaerolineaceae bacterium]
MNQETPTYSMASKRDEDIEIIIEMVWLDLQGIVSRDIVCQTVASLYKRYDDAKVRNLIPVIVQRKAKELLVQESSKGFVIKESRND